MIEITGVDLTEFAKKVYELSAPQGLGFLHFTPKPISDQEAGQYLLSEKDDPNCALDMDYVHGRACKMTVRRQDGKLFIRDAWYDHTDEQLKQLLDFFHIKVPEPGKHSPACNCFRCREKVPA